MDVVDRDALKRAMAMALKESDARAAQLKAKLKDEPWEAVAKFAAYSCQVDNLHLRPWEEAPCHGELVEGDGSVTRDPKAAALMDKLKAAGLSKWEPDPEAALGEG